MTDTLPVYEQTRAARYDHPDATQRHPEAPVSIATDIETGIEDVKTFVGDHLGGILQRAAQLEANPVVDALQKAALGPEFEALAAEFITKVAAWAQAKAPAAVAEPAPAAAPAGDVLAEPEFPPGSVFEPQAGPVVAGQA